jgi:hypothetical protein
VDLEECVVIAADCRHRVSVTSSDNRDEIFPFDYFALCTGAIDESKDVDFPYILQKKALRQNRVRIISRDL